MTSSNFQCTCTKNLGKNGSKDCLYIYLCEPCGPWCLQGRKIQAKVERWWYKHHVLVGLLDALFPCECIDNILHYTNTSLCDQNKKVIKREFYKVIGFSYATILGILRQRQDFWSTEVDLFPAPAFGHTFRQGLHRLEETLMALFFVQHGHNDGKWYSNKSLVRNVCFKVEQGPYTRLQDEGWWINACLVWETWYGRGGVLGDRPAVMKMKRKLQSVDCKGRQLLLLHWIQW